MSFIDDLIEENDRLSQEPGQGGGFLDNFVKMPEGNGHVVVRLLPPAKSGMFDRKKNPFFQATRIHKVNGKSLHCPKDISDGKWKGECPICKYYNWLWQESEKKAPDEAKSMQSKAREIKPIERYYYNVIVRKEMNEQTGEMKENVGPKILSVGKTLHKMIIRAIVGDEAMDEKPLGDVTDPKTGRDFKIIKAMRKSGNDSFPNYSDSKFIEPSVLGDPDQVAQWLENLHDLVSLRTLKDAEELKEQLKIHLGLIQDVSNDFDPTEFQKGPAKTSVVVTEVEEKPVDDSKVRAAEKQEPEKESDVSLVDEDFLSELKNM